MEQEVFVYIDIQGVPSLVGKLWTRVRGKQESATFEHDKEWLANPKGSSVRVPFLSAMSMLNARDNETHSYLEIADALKMYGARPKADLKELFARMVFNILISNTDDHLRNHGFLYQDIDGWRLSPAYDLNPVPTDLKPRILSTNISEDDATASLVLAFEVAAQFDLSSGEALKIAKKMGKAVSNWREIGEAMGLSKSSLKRMASAFEHDDLKASLR